MLCLLCSSTNVSDIEVMCLCCELVVDTLAVKYAVCNFMAFVCGGELGKK